MKFVLIMFLTQFMISCGFKADPSPVFSPKASKIDHEVSKRKSQPD
jgi:hypothetical protein